MQFALIVAALEDKIVQYAVGTVLDQIWEEDFLGFQLIPPIHQSYPRIGIRSFPAPRWRLLSLLQCTGEQESIAYFRPLLKLYRML